ncbi:MAG TPA: uroporphyrinogen-III synthase, partial [Chloroflexota bacterium]|nr:uroporphyrinogen-III synthase [Chloroflexota bacterium]
MCGDGSPSSGEPSQDSSGQRGPRIHDQRGKLTVLVTRGAGRNGSLETLLSRQGLHMEAVEVLEFRPPDDCAPLDTALSSLDRFEYLIFTSANTVRFVVERLPAIGRSVGDLSAVTIIAIGQATA